VGVTDVEVGSAEDPSVLRGHYALSKAEGEFGPTSVYLAADLDEAPREGESPWREAEAAHPPDDLDTAYLTEINFREQVAAGKSAAAAGTAAVVELRSMWALAWRVGCKALDEATVSAALSALGRGWIADQLRQTDAVAAHTAHALATVTAGELLGTMARVPLIPTRVTGRDRLVDSPAYRTAFISEFHRWRVLWKRMERHSNELHDIDDDDDDTQKEEFLEAPVSFAEPLKDGALNPGRLFDVKFADIAADPGTRAERQKRDKLAKINKAEFGLPAANALQYHLFAGLWIRPCWFQQVVMDVLERQLGCSGGWVQRSALHVLQLSFETVVAETLCAAQMSAKNRKSAVVAGADLAFVAADTGLAGGAAVLTTLTKAMAAQVETGAAVPASPRAAAERPLAGMVAKLARVAGCVSGTRSIVEVGPVCELVLDAARAVATPESDLTISPDALTALCALLEGRLTTMVLCHGRNMAARAAAEATLVALCGVSLADIPAAGWVAAGVDLDGAVGPTDDDKAVAIAAAVTKLMQFQAR
jgi:hypothetical protein